jgi:hypothetical protein
VTGREWITAYASELGVAPPDDATIETLLGIAGVAAHASERTAAPISCYLIGKAGIDLAKAQSVAAALAQTKGDREG